MLRRAVVLSVTVEGLSQADAARRFKVSEATVSRWVARYRAEGDAAFEPRSRRPKSSPTALSGEVVGLILELRDDLVLQGLDAGPDTIAWHLAQHHTTHVSISSIRRHLIAAGKVTPQPRKRPRSSYIRFEAALPNETWQSDFTHWRLADGTDTEILTWLDDHARYALSVTAHRRVTGNIVVDTFTETAENTGYPASVLSDNGMVYTARFAFGQGGRNQLETLLGVLGIDQKLSRPNHPTTCGKVERFQQTMKKWLAAQPRAETIADLQEQLDKFLVIYNQHRPHRSLERRTPAIVYNLRPKATPRNAGAGIHIRVRTDTIDNHGKVSLRRAGRMHHIGLGRARKGQPVLLLIADLDIRVVHRNTGEVLAQLTLDPTRGYQPQHPKTKSPNS
jgi:transposase InsO family protein